MFQRGPLQQRKEGLQRCIAFAGVRTDPVEPSNLIRSCGHTALTVLKTAGASRKRNRLWDVDPRRLRSPRIRRVGRTLLMLESEMPNRLVLVVGSASELEIRDIRCAAFGQSDHVMEL